MKVTLSWERQIAITMADSDRLRHLPIKQTWSKHTYLGFNMSFNGTVSFNTANMIHIIRNWLM